MRSITNSSKRVFRRCARLYYYMYDQMYRPVEIDDNLRFGSLIHTALNAWWKAPRDQRFDLAMNAISNFTSDPFERVRAEETIRGYHIRWGEHPIKTILVEPVFSAPIINPETGQPSRTYCLDGRIDVLCNDQGETVLMEHKTSSMDITTGSQYWRRLLMDPQISDYCIGAAALGYKVRRCVYDVIGKPGLRPLKATTEDKRKYKKDGTLYANQRDMDEDPEDFRARLRNIIAESPEKFYQRGSIVRLEKEIREHQEDMWQIAKNIRIAELYNRWPRDPDGCDKLFAFCDRYGKLCAFFDVCTGCDSLENEERFMRVDTPHVELVDK